MGLFSYLSEAETRAAQQRSQQAQFIKRYWQAILGGFLAFTGLGFFSGAFDPASGPLIARLLLFLVGVAAWAAAACCFALLVRRAMREARQKKYVAILAGVETMRVQEIAALTNQNQPTVLRDIQSMIDAGAIEDLYIDYSAQRVVSKRHVPVNASKAVTTCAACGSNNEVLVGIPKPCAGCGEPLMVG